MSDLTDYEARTLKWLALASATPINEEQRTTLESLRIGGFVVSRGNEFRLTWDGLHALAADIARKMVEEKQHANL